MNNFYIIVLSMSHLIEGVQVQGPLIFQAPLPKIIKPKFKRYIKSNTLEDLFQREKGDLILDHICHRYSQIEVEKMKQEREMFINNKCSALKKKLKVSLNTNVNGRTVAGFFEDHDKPVDIESIGLHPMLNIKQLLQGVSPSIELSKKYQSKINIKMATIQQAKYIQQQKIKHRRMLSYTNHQNSSPMRMVNMEFEKYGKKSVHCSKRSAKNKIQSRDISITFQDKFSKIKPSGAESGLLKENRDRKLYNRSQLKKSLPVRKARFWHLTDEFGLFHLN